MSLLTQVQQLGTFDWPEGAGITVFTQNYFAYYHSHNYINNYINTTISTWRTTKSTICIFFHTHNYWPYIIHMSHNDKYLHIIFFIIDFIIIMYIAQADKLVN